LEYHSPYEAKRTLLSVCEKGKDFIAAAGAVKSTKKGINGHSFDNIKLSKVGLFTFLTRPTVC